MTVAGALLGGAVGHELGHDSYSPGYSTLEHRCHTINDYSEREEIVGYRVKYRYNGETFWTRTSEHPGRRIDVKVHVRPDSHHKGRHHRGDRDYDRYQDNWKYGNNGYGRGAGFEVF